MYKIGFDAKRLFNNFTGLGNYSRTLVRNLSEYYPDNQYFLFSPKVKRNEETKFFLDSAMYHLELPKHTPGFYWRSWAMKKDLVRRKIDLFHGLSHELPFGIQQTKIPTVVTIHDLIFKHYPDQYAWIDRQIYDRKFRYACKQSDRILAISESTKQDIIQFYNIKPEKISVIYQSCHERFMSKKTPKHLASTREKYKLPADFFLYVGSLIERKNLLGIVKAYSHLPKDLSLPLVIIGEGDLYKKRVIELAQELGVIEKMIFLRPDFEDFPALYQLAKIFLYPSYFEGFGIPVLEALFSETPVITSNISSLPEAAGDGAILVAPSNSEAIAIAMERLLTDDVFRQQVVSKGVTYAQGFKGEQFSHQLMDLYQNVLG